MRPILTRPSRRASVVQIARWNGTVSRRPPTPRYQLASHQSINCQSYSINKAASHSLRETEGLGSIVNTWLRAAKGSFTACKLIDPITWRAHWACHNCTSALIGCSETGTVSARLVLDMRTTMRPFSQCRHSIPSGILNVFLFRLKFVFIKHWSCQSCYLHPQHGPLDLACQWHESHRILSREVSAKDPWNQVAGFGP